MSLALLDASIIEEFNPRVNDTVTLGEERLKDAF